MTLESTNSETLAHPVINMKIIKRQDFIADIGVILYFNEGYSKQSCVAKIFGQLLCVPSCLGDKQSTRCG
ncbi:hypothetical protein B9Z50_11725 [Limnohabitans sp. Bal53]|nr:hypothetical protein B9Z50_11725 [Limnohabitans sp. Bal53]